MHLNCVQNTNVGSVHLARWPDWPDLGSEHRTIIRRWHLRMPDSDRDTVYCKWMCEARTRCNGVTLSHHTDGGIGKSCHLFSVGDIAACTKSPGSDTWIKSPSTSSFAGSSASHISTWPYGIHIVQPWTVHIYVATHPLTHPFNCRVTNVGDQGPRGADVFVAACHSNPHRDHLPLPTPQPHKFAATKITAKRANQGRSLLAHENHRGRSSTPRIAMCVPPLYGNVTTTQVWNHIDYHMASGVEHTYLYLTNCSAMEQTDVGLHPNTTTMCMEWILYVRMHQRAQNWANNDCIQRTASDGYDLVLTIDLDEHLVIHHGLTLPQLVSGLPHADVYTFGSKKFKSNVRNYVTTCLGSHMNHDVCQRQYGWRKHMVRPQAIWAANIHWCDQCKDEQMNVVRTCSTHHLNVTSSAFLAHDRLGQLGVGFLSTYVPGFFG